MMNQGKYLVPHESDNRVLNPYTGIKSNFSPARNLNSVLIDSSSNGFGKVVSTTRPIDEDDDNWVIVYRQNAGIGTTHGQLASAFTDEINAMESWDVYTNINKNGDPPWGGGGFGTCEGGTCAQARYPSAAASPDFPYAIWNEYTDEQTYGSTYGGRAYYSYDSFEWEGDSWGTPVDIDLLWETAAKDQWSGSAQFSWDDDMDMGVLNAVFDDWTRENSFLFHTEIIEEGLAIFATEQIAIDANLLGDPGYTTPPAITMNDSGQGVMGVIGLFPGVDPAYGTCTSNITCNHVPIFKLTADHGANWYGPSDGNDFYFVPDDVFDNIFETMVTPTLDEPSCDDGVSADQDTCEAAGGTWDAADDGLAFGLGEDIDYDLDGTIEAMEVVSAYTVDDWFSWYDWDIRINNEGDLHIIMSFVPESFEAYYTNHSAAGFYHLTINIDNLDSPGEVNSATGWNWSYLIPGGPTWTYDVDNSGWSQIFDSFAQISFAKDDPNVVWAVLNMAGAGDYRDIQTEYEATNCAQWDTYIWSTSDLSYWSYDLWVAKSTDGGISWGDAINVTETPWDHYNEGTYYGPEEMYPHTPAYSTSNEVYIMYQMPNWAWNEIGEGTGADHMNFVYVGSSEGGEGGMGIDSDDPVNEHVAPRDFELSQNYPNPFNPSTTIKFSLPELSVVNISIYDINGRLVNTLANQSFTSGTHNVVWNGDDMYGNLVSAGIYMYSLTSKDVSISNKMVLVK